MAKSLIDKGVCRTAPASPGLLRVTSPVLTSDNGSKSVLVLAHSFVPPKRAKLGFRLSIYSRSWL